MHTGKPDKDLDDKAASKIAKDRALYRDRRRHGLMKSQIRWLLVIVPHAGICLVSHATRLWTMPC